MRQPTIRAFARFAAFALLATPLLACVTGRASAATASASRTHSSARAARPTDPEVASFVKLVNAHRIARGLPALIWDSRVAAVAKSHSQQMVDEDFFSHTTPDGVTTWGRLAARGISYSHAGENIAWGQKTGKAVFRGWLDSPGHRANIEQDSYTHHGVGKVGTRWTHVFIRPRSGARASR